MMNRTTFSLPRLYTLLSSIGLLQQLRQPPPFLRFSPIVDVVGLGRVQGLIDYTREGNKAYYEFKGIPFGKAPVGDLRFEAPVAYGPWGDHILIADRWGPSCLQFDATLRGKLWGKEDCLKLNIFTPELKPRSGLPVIAYVHGGGFVGGDPSLFHPKYFMDHQIVFVTFNYRLASLGFLNSGDALIRGNMGFKDQNLALRWIRNHISNFGGDPEKVTLMGESAGGASTHYHILSPLSKGLFRRAIMQSGSLGSPWSFTRNPRNQAVKFGAKVGCPVENTTVLVECLKRKDPRDIVKHHEIILSPIHTQDEFFTGSIEGLSREDSFLTDNPYSLLAHGDFPRIPVMFGVTDGDGGLKTARLQANPEILSGLGKGWDALVPILMHYDPSRRNVSEELRRHFFPTNLEPSKDLVSLTKMLSLGLFHEGVHRMGSIHAAHGSPTYLYYYTYQSQLIPTSYVPLKSAVKGGIGFPWLLHHLRAYLDHYMGKLVGDLEDDPARFGASHGEGLLQLFKPSVLEVREGHPDYKFSRDYVSSLVQFAEEEDLMGSSSLSFAGVPWPPVNPTEEPMSYMELAGSGGRLIKEPFAEGVKLLESLHIREPEEIGNW